MDIIFILSGGYRGRSKCRSRKVVRLGCMNYVGVGLLGGFDFRKKLL